MVVHSAFRVCDCWVDLWFRENATTQLQVWNGNDSEAVRFELSDLRANVL